MKIYIGHSTNWDYKNKLYKPILNSELNKRNEIIFPHLEENATDTCKIIEDADLFIAEVSLPSLGLGIEIGRAEMKQKRILCIYNNKYKCSSSLKFVNADILDYSDEEDMINKIIEYVKK